MQNNNGIIPTHSTFKNWHKPIAHMKTKKQHLSLTSAVGVSGHDINGVQLTFTDEKTGKQISLFLTEKDKKLMLMNIDRFVHGKEVTREMYGLTDTDL